MISLTKWTGLAVAVLAGIVVGLFLGGAYLAITRSADPGQTFVGLASALVALAAIAGTGFANWLVSRDKAERDRALEEVRVQLKEVGDARQVRIAAIYARQFTAADELLSALGATGNKLTFLRLVATVKMEEWTDDPAARLRALKQALADARPLFDGCQAAIGRHLIWLEKDVQPVVRRYGDTLLAVTSNIVLGPDETGAVGEHLDGIQELLYLTPDQLKEATAAVRQMIEPRNVPSSSVDGHV